MVTLNTMGDFSDLSGPQKAAILLMSLGEDNAARILEQFSDDEIREMSQNMANLGTVNAEVVEELYLDFAHKLTSTSTLIGSFESTERLLSKVLDQDRVNQIMEDIRGPAGRTMWDKLGNVSAQVLANYLKNEYPQTVAVVMSRIRADHAAEVLALLPESFALEVMGRMLSMESVQKEVLRDIEDVLRTEFMSNLARQSRQDPHAMMAEIFNAFDRNTEGRFISALEERNEDAAGKIRALMFTFEDLLKLDAAGVQNLLRAVDKDKLGLALKGTTDKMRDLFFTNMSERAGKILKEDMEAMGPVRVKDVDASQAYIVQMAKDLADKGEIMLSSGKEEDELIY